MNRYPVMEKENISLRSLNGRKLSMMLVGAAKALSRRFPPQTPVYVTALVPSVEPIVCRLAGEALSTDASVVHLRRKPEQDNA